MEVRSDTSTSLCCNLTFLTLEQPEIGHVTVGLNFGTFSDHNVVRLSSSHNVSALIYEAC